MQHFTAVEYLKIDIANSFGKDKLNWEERIDWFNNHQLDPSKADNPSMAYAGLQAMEDYKTGRPSGYPISLDATCSGMQWLSVLAHDRKGAEYTNIIDTGRRRDAYTDLYNVLRSTTDLNHIEREHLKKSIMTSLYSSEATPKAIFGEDNYEEFVKMMTREVPNVWAINTLFLDLWDPSVDHHYWVMPDGFEVYKPVEVTRTAGVNVLGSYFEFSKKIQGAKKKGRSIGADVTHSVDALAARELVRRCSYTPETINRVMGLLDGSKRYYGTREQTDSAKKLKALYEASGMLSTRVLQCLNVHSIKMFEGKDIIKLLKSLPKKPFHVLTVHDEFRALPRYGNDLREQYRNVVQDVANSDLLNHIIRYINPNVNITLNDDISKEIGCEYAIC